MITLLNADARLLPLPDRSVHCCITSPPYWGLRDYGTARWEGGDLDCNHSPANTPQKRGLATSTLQGGKETTGHQREGYKAMCARCGAVRVDDQIGLEPTPDQYVADIVACMREVWRVLRDDGTLWLVLGDSYANDTKWGGNSGGKHVEALHGKPGGMGRERRETGLKAKDLVGIPWRVALALQADGWYLRSDIIWSKPNPMPESVTDRPTKSHEYVFLLSKSERYFYDAEAIKENAQTWTGQAGTFERTGPVSTHILPGQAAAQHRPSRKGGNFSRRYAEEQPGHGDMQLERGDYSNGRNKRSVWTVATRSFGGAHFATFPPDLVEPMVLAGTSARGCCPACGAPWVRVVEKGLTAHDGETQSAYAKGTTANRLSLLRQAARERGIEYTNEAQTIGWRPSCDCDAGEPIPCTVLDSFAGTATVGRVCARHGRRFVGVELNPAYIALARERTSNVQMEMRA